MQMESAAQSLPQLDQIVLGTMSFGDTADENAVNAVLRASYELGIRSIDTANGYGGGRAEAMLAPFLREHRDEIYVATKAGIPHPDGDGEAPLSPRALRRSVAGSLRRLGVDGIDLLYLHQPDHGTPLEQTVAELARLHQDGSIAQVGVSNFAAWQVADLQQLADEAGLPPVRIAQNVYNLVSRRLEHEWFDFANMHDVRTVCYNPLAGGLLARPVRDDEDLPVRFSRSALSAMYRTRYLTEAFRGAALELSAAANEAGVSLAEACLRWVLGAPAPVSVLIGTDRVDHLHANVAALRRGPLTADVQERLTEITDPLLGWMNPYQR